MEDITILIVDDEKPMRQMIRKFLEKENYYVLEASDGTDALLMLEKHTPHLLIVDVMMPFMDGFSLAKEVKEKSNIPLIFLSAKGEEWDRVHGLRLGGDDYIVKPFSPTELLARVESVLRRSYQHTNKDLFKIGPLVIDHDSFEITLHGTVLPLTLKEFGLLEILAKNHGRAYTRSQLLHLVWGEHHLSSERTVDTHIKTLRLKMGTFGSLIKTVWGVGYKFEV